MTWDQITLPPGATALAPEMQTKYLEIVNGDLRPQERAQALIDFQNEVYTATEATRSATWDTLQEAWLNEIKSDPVVGGPKYEANKATVDQLLTQYGTPALTSMLDVTGAKNALPLFQLLVKLAPFALEASNPGGNPAPAPATSPLESRMYPSMQPKT